MTTTLIDHSKCDHDRTSSARARCRRSLRASGAPITPRAPRAPREDDDDEKRPADPARCCDNCNLRLIEWQGTDPITRMITRTCTKCRYVIKRATDLKPLEV